MSPDVIKRRKHKNSKFGCPNCKRRRVKCTEDLPQCMNCVKHKVKCGYLDYSDDKLAQLKEYKEQHQRQLLQQDEDSYRLSNDSGKNSVSPDATTTAPPGEAVTGISIQPTKSNNSNLDDEINNLTLGFKPTSPAPIPPPLQSLHPPTHTANYTNLLNHGQNSISQNFDDLLPTASDLSIVYPVYYITNNQGLSPFSGQNVMNYEYPNLDGFYSNGQSLSPVDIQQQSLLQSLSSSVISQDLLIQMASPVPVKTEKFLPNAVASMHKFKRLTTERVDYRTLLINVVINLGPLINQGLASLLEIRELYSLWLNSFLFKSYESDLMFSCLINLTTNFLISNPFNNFNLIDSSANNFLHVTNMKNILIMVSIKYYAFVIKGIRLYLNKNFDPELCSSVSYILSLMSIYDPEATYNSTRCFSDGLFSVLKYNIDLSIKKGFTPPLLIPIHLRLMHNIEKSIYFPGYDPTFLQEYQVSLAEFGKFLSQTSMPGNPELYAILRKNYQNLWEFTHTTLSEYLPVLISQLEDNTIQQEILFRMTSRWVRLFPSRFLIIDDSAPLSEKVLYLYFKLFKKAMFAVFPQVKFYFLRDFDSPLMLDVFNYINDNEIFNSPQFDDPDLKHYRSQLKSQTAYLIRALNYFQKRLQFLYKTIVYQSSTKNLFPIEDRKDFIINIPELRKIFYESLDLKETNIKSFNHTFIRPYHFPHTGDIDMDDEPVDVELETLTPMGFLKDDTVGI
ncbi:hypothetical protein PSN45_001300 [Yamadazyma tenuis]|uniref:Zn(2)-C6 fungal-type domain-containing protein n=1 Tax=Candida tenuis (strain ATCC 10573 / BCRC 21748 / CBS 615 / JCM 9827 / NBRC 10315 / NRRL Y-1498 / VKM Y-70) TaxID=590646 RepID=G3BD31_CANTC|nr:uncharacterized protein CANTEDRAFT_100201 [Yamadazyma tenuis ATCC 10573]EGV60907.1 hypothetical protein CANTEDRAFT_100201 [Yamadazyma tenuis ATCC 10573]WEJ93824.1 hypothetical protein PSN45_001300 [Yamadazyma tenuis]